MRSVQVPIPVDAVAGARVCNPKREFDATPERDDRLFPYYAGYSTRFTRELLASLGLKEHATILDPWNGSGTTTRVASALGYASIGCDLNPVMTLIAKANMTSALEAPAVVPLAHEIAARAHAQTPDLSDDPLCRWLTPSSARTVRQIERQIHQTLVSASVAGSLGQLRDFERLAPLAAMMYLALFRAVRRLLAGFLGSNPTWVKAPTSPAERLRPSAEKITNSFEQEASLLAERLSTRSNTASDEVASTRLLRASSTQIPLSSESVDLVLTSPPYCTRIDYAVATSIELAIIGTAGTEFEALRRELLGNATVSPQSSGAPKADWGETCLEFLDAVKTHPSRASSTYYYKNHLQYFAGLDDSIAELSRVTKRNGLVVAIVQDSYYKDVHNDLPTIFSEMASRRGLRSARRQDFSSSRSMVNMNSKSRQYVKSRSTTESVLFMIAD